VARSDAVPVGGLLTPKCYDEIDSALDDEIQIDPYAGDPPSRRSDKEINRVLSILDSLEERGNG
jgi:hypothetical protein